MATKQQFYGVPFGWIKIRIQEMTPAKVAKKAGMSRSMLSRILHGKRRPDGLLKGSTPADRLAAVLGLSLQELGKFCDWAEKTGGLKL